MFDYEVIAAFVLSALLFPLVAMAWGEMGMSSAEYAADGIDIRNPDFDIASRNARRASADALFWFLLLSFGYAAIVALAFPLLRPGFVDLEAPVVSTPFEKVGSVGVLMAAFLITAVLLFIGAALAAGSTACRRIANILELTKQASARYLDAGRSDGFVLYLRNFAQERRDFERGVRTHPHLPPPLMVGTKIRETVAELASKWVVVEAANLKHPPRLYERQRAGKPLPSHLPISLYDRDNWEGTVAQWIGRARCVVLHLNSQTEALAAEAAMATASRRPLVVFAEIGVWRVWQNLSLPHDTPLLLYESVGKGVLTPSFMLTRAGSPADHASPSATMTIDQMQKFLSDWVARADSAKPSPPGNLILESP